MTRRRFSSSPSLVLLLLLSPAALVAAQCDGGANDSDANSDADRATALYYKLGAIASILAAGAIGVLLPVVGQKKFPALHPNKSVFFVVKAFAAGVILSTGFIHVLPDAFESLTSPCLPEKPWGSFPFAGFIAMAAAMGTLALDSFATSFFSRAAAHGDNKSSDPEAAAAGDDGGGQMAVHTHATHGHSHGAISAAGGGASQQLVRHRVISQVLEVGIVVHSVIIGISLGASQSPATVRPLLAALTFHQFFEGMGLGGCIAQAKFRPRVVTMMTLFFSLTTPLGIAIGIGASSAYEDNSATALVLEGAFNAASAGILIYMALVDLLAADFMNPKVQASGRLQVGVQVALLLGAGFMSLLAIWA